jgi:hypothetical protein
MQEMNALNFSTLVRSRLATLGYAQKHLAREIQVTDSYISQLLTRKKAPPGRDRTDIYTKMEAFLQLKPGPRSRCFGSFAVWSCESAFRKSAMRCVRSLKDSRLERSSGWSPRHFSS